MQTVTTTEELAAFCQQAKEAPYVTIDTEFLRERTYWAKLCLIQLALPGKAGPAVLVDPIAGPDMSLEPLYDLMRHEKTIKVLDCALPTPPNHLSLAKSDNPCAPPPSQRP